jgi:hypothetical protein
MFFLGTSGNPRFIVCNLNLFNTKHKPDVTYFQKDCPSYGIAVRHTQCVALQGHEVLLGTMHVATDIHTSVQCNILTVC